MAGKVQSMARESADLRRMHAKFIARGLAASNDARRTGVYFSAESVHDELRALLANARMRLRGGPSPSGAAPTRTTN